MQKPHKTLCGLGSWREQQQTIEINQKFVCRLTRPHRILWGSTIDLFRLMPLRRLGLYIIYDCFLRLPIIIVFTYSLSHLSNADILAAYLALQSSQGDITSLASLASSTQSL